ncbi:MAG TPA: outer membrane beta-barrel protein [Vicinamibacterales bacterium]|nr:outer membrane beta-barrel protein [Vicinamibacterales bacterium]
MRRFLPCAVVLFSLSVPAYSQTPDTGMVAVGANVGAFLPDDQFEPAITIDGIAEYYLTPRIGVRGLLGWTSPGFDGRDDDHFRQVRLLFNVTYNWEFIEWHPYVTIGAGAYFVRQKLDERPDPEGERRGGINLGGGVEYFTSTRQSIKGEFRWDFVSHPPGLPDASGATLTIGLKRYF